ncbi:type III secretion system export apparatus subunit SctT [Erwinia amylovora]|uniref:Type III secretion protein HrcT n=4 Tax=Erwinia amylovora TaxID=552 RepID=A0A831EIQ8_ERWAM|nr:type III secretion system export apparatus subunit SctT [Erwinia amylovora]CBX79342.1 Type III secretion protein HrcT [Erwinia amylovora ATCC BAA-2158]CCP01820.1 Type III secretion protein HrcT [Erwinia amylovora Ea644]CDK14126.1 Type III secretion protein HrcT [Erwinia amylovora LA635]CDK17493.1 Type III secretion protein HrcT [Erwinia amylovora LA636]CDK20862.1 Type III secretion protein HrcT [Erwinia amylovora LA637]
MSSDAIHTVYQFLFALTLGAARIYPCLILMPVFSFNILKGMVRTGVVLALSLMPAIGLQAQLAVQMPDWPQLIGLILKEVTIGILLGLLLGMPFWLFQSAGALFDNQRGALIGGQLNPALGSDVTPLGLLLQQTLILLLILGIGLSGITQIIWDSYRIWPVLQWLPLPHEEGFKQYLALLADTFTHIIIYAGPLVALLLLLDFSIAILSLYSPQLQVFVLSVPAKCLVGLLFFVLYIPTLNALGEDRILQLRDLSKLLPLILGGH